MCFTCCNNKVQGVNWDIQSLYINVVLPNSHSLRLKIVNSSVTSVEEITPEQSSLSLAAFTRSV